MKFVSRPQTVQYARRIAEAMGLSGWVISEATCFASDGCYAEVQAVYGQRSAVLYLSADWEELSAEVRRSTIVHELVHLHLAHLTFLSYDMFASVSKSSSDCFRAALTLAEEYAVDAIAEAWAPSLPLPRGKA